ncbi:uncharacterized protein [Bemisia tabaci]|uniref:uncharacterized protein isoform X2 n=1 Tax=Bemisia tabaci TaxID=7038 RepID=UPI003B27D121
MTLFVLLCSLSLVFAADDMVTTNMPDEKSLDELLTEYKVLEKWRQKHLLEARKNPKVLEHRSAVEFLDGLEELHFTFKKRREYFETVLRMIRVNGNSLNPSESITKILKCVKDLEITWKKHENRLLGKGCQGAVMATKEPLLDEPIIEKLVPAIASAALRYYQMIPLFNAEVKASPLAELIITIETPSTLTPNSTVGNTP